MTATYTNLGNERMAKCEDIQAGQQVFVFGQFRTVRSISKPDWRRRFETVVVDTDGQTWPLGVDKTFTVRD
jgi:hypothetical protein